ncbi:MAG: MalY/PatB family protein [Bacteroidota bacterium]
MFTDFDKRIDRQGTNSLKWDGCRRIFGAEDLLPMWLADMDFAAPPAALAAAGDRVAHGVFGYPAGAAGALDALASWVERRHGWRIQTEWAMHTPGVVPALSLAVLALTEPGEKIVIQPPVYPPFYDVVRDHGRVLVENPLRLEGGRYVMDLQGLEALLDDATRMLILCSPHNPVGRVWSRDELAALGELCLRHDVLLVADEIHADLVYGGSRHCCAASLSPDLARRTVTMMAPSKTFNVAGLVAAAAIIPDPGLRRRFGDMQRRLHLGGGNVFGLAVMEAVYRQGDDWLADLLRYLESNRDFLLEYLRDQVPEVGIVSPEGTYLAWLDCRGLGMDADRLRRFLIDEARLGLNDGRDFGPPGEGFARLNFGCPRAALREGLERLAAAVRRRRHA